VKNFEVNLGPRTFSFGDVDCSIWGRGGGLKLKCVLMDKKIFVYEALIRRLQIRFDTTILQEASRC